jgi:hypothetical protein
VVEAGSDGTSVPDSETAAGDCCLWGSSCKGRDNALSFRFVPSSLAFTILPALLLSVLSLHQSASLTTYEAAVLKDRERRVDRLRNGDFSPLKKVAIHRLNDSGRVTVGSGPEADIRIEGQGIEPVHVVVEGTSATPKLRALGGSIFSTWDKKPRNDWMLRHEYGFHLGRLNILYWVNQRTGARTLQVFDPEAPAMKHFKNLDFFAIDPAYRVKAEVVPYPAPERVKLIDSVGKEQDFWVYGQLKFRVKNVPCALELYAPSLEPELIRKEGFTLMFTDETSGKESYPATRYLSLQGMTSGEVTVDFNGAFTPLAISAHYIPVPSHASKTAYR